MRIHHPAHLLLGQLLAATANRRLSPTAAAALLAATEAAELQALRQRLAQAQPTTAPKEPHARR